MNRIKKLLEQRAQLVADLEAIKTTAETENRAFSEDEITKFDDLEKQIKNVDATISAENRATAIQNVVHSDGTGADGKAELEERAFVNYIKGTIENRADVNMTTTDNGAVIPTSIANKIIQKVYDICPIYQMATRYNVGGTLTIPVYDEDSQEITMAYATEFTELESTSGKMTSVSLTGFLAGVLTKISKSLMNNSNFDIASFVINKVAEKAKKWIEKELLLGTTNKIAGLSGVTQSVTTASATAIVTDELIDLQESVPDDYQDGAIFIMNKATRTAIRKLKDSDGNYLLNRDVAAKWGYTLLGKPVYTSAQMPTIAAGKTTIYYGDMSGLAVKVSEDVTIEVLREKFATQHAIGVVAWMEVDAKIENAQKLAKLVQKAS